MNNKSILIVDDLEECLNLLEYVLRDEYPTLHFAKSGAEALRIVNHYHIDLILTDYEMPGTDGKWLMERVSGIPIIVLSASFKICEQDVLNLGAQALMIEPFSVLALQVMIQKVFKGCDIRPLAR